MADSLNDIMQGYLDDFKRAKENDTESIIDGNFPLMWFGDLNAFQKADNKVVTVGILPSDHEFDPKPGNPREYARFPIADPSTADDYRDYKENFNTYFKNDPYGRYFTDYENDIVRPILNDDYGYGFKDAPTPKYPLVHLDCRTAIATHPRWSELTTSAQIEEKNQLIKPGNALFVEFLQFLQPDVTFVSSGRDDFFTDVMSQLGVDNKAGYGNQRAYVFWVKYDGADHESAIFWKDNGQWPSANSRYLAQAVEQSKGDHQAFFNKLLN